MKSFLSEMFNINWDDIDPATLLGLEQDDYEKLRMFYELKIGFKNREELKEAYLGLVTIIGNSNLKGSMLDIIYHAHIKQLYEAHQEYLDRLDE